MVSYWMEGTQNIQSASILFIILIYNLEIISNLEKSSKVNSKNSHMAFSHFPQMLRSGTSAFSSLSLTLFLSIFCTVNMYFSLTQLLIAVGGEKEKTIQ